MDTKYEKMLQYFNAIDEISKSISLSTNLKAVQENILQKAMKILQVEAISLLLLSEERNELYFHISKGEKEKEIEKKKDILKIKVGVGISGWVAQMGKPVIINNPEKHPSFYKQIDTLIGFTTRNIVCVPLIVKNRVKGVIEAINKRDADFDEVDMVFINNVATNIAVIIENVELYEEITRTKNYYMNIIENMHGGLIVMNKDGKITSCNRTACRILGLINSEIDGKSCKEALARQKEIISILFNTLDDKQSLNRMETSTKGKDNEQITIGYGTIIINDLAGNMMGVGIIFQDLTHLKEIKNRVEKMLA